jgi:hypothetical protein
MEGVLLLQSDADGERSTEMAERSIAPAWTRWLVSLRPCRYGRFVLLCRTTGLLASGVIGVDLEESWGESWYLVFLLPLAISLLSNA